MRYQIKEWLRENVANIIGTFLAVLAIYAVENLQFPKIISAFFQKPIDYLFQTWRGLTTVESTVPEGSAILMISTSIIFPLIFTAYLIYKNKNHLIELPKHLMKYRNKGRGNNE